MWLAPFLPLFLYNHKCREHCFMKTARKTCPYPFFFMLFLPLSLSLSLKSLPTLPLSHTGCSRDHWHYHHQSCSVAGLPSVHLENHTTCSFADCISAMLSWFTPSLGCGSAVAATCWNITEVCCSCTRYAASLYDISVTHGFVFPHRRRLFALFHRISAGAILFLGSMF